MRDKVLLVDDDDLLRRTLAFNLEQAGYEVNSAASAEVALAIFERDPPDLVVLDVGLPGIDGLQTLRQLRRESNVPVVLLTARRRELDEIVGLEMGADDYVVKPFDTDVLLARIRAVLRRGRESAPQAPAGDRTSVVGDLVIDPASHTALLAGQPLRLAAREFSLLHTLALEAGRVLSVADLLHRVWGPEFNGEPQVLYVHIRWLREKIEVDPSNPRRIVTVRGVGYKLVPQPVAAGNS